MPKDSGIGASSKRREDIRFLTGLGTYVDDINRPGQGYAVFLRSQVAHGRIVSVDTAAAAAAPGVVAVLTGADVAADELGGVPCGWQVDSADGTQMKEPPHPLLAADKVNHVGDPIAMVVAETLDQAKDAAALIEVEIETLAAVVDAAEALADGAPQIHDDAPGNMVHDWALGDADAVAEAIAGAHHVTRLELTNQRLVANAMEPRAALTEYDAGRDETTMWTTTQNPHLTRLLMAAYVLHIPEHKLRVIGPDVGGGFGSKIFHYAEEALVTWAARKLRRPVKWTAERSESFISDAQGRDHRTVAELAMDENGKFLALKVDNIANLGAYLSTFAPGCPTWFYGTVLSGQYVIPAIHVRTRSAFTNTVVVDAYRGAGRPEATYLIERLVNVAAAEMGLDQAELRRRNFIQPDQFPYETPVALTYDTGDFGATLDKADQIADIAGFAARKAEAAARGKLRGIGLSTYLEACGIAPSRVAGALGVRAGLYDSAKIRVTPTGGVTVFTGVHSHGQGHETTFAQIVADMLGIPEAQVDVVHGDTASIPFGMGTYGSRSLVVGGSAIVKAVDKIIAKSIKIAAHLLEASEDDIVFENGEFTVKGTDKKKTFGEIALTAYVPHNYPIETLEPGLEETAFYDPLNWTFPAGSYWCEVEIDPETGVVEVVRFTAVDDFGNVINPMIVEGQVHGGIAQGLGQAMIERAVYDGDGQLLSGSYMDYAMPRADDMPNFTVDQSCNTPCTHNPLGAKGCGEAGTIGATPALVNAVVDALKDRGITHMEMPLTPNRVWAAIQAAK